MKGETTRRPPWRLVAAIVVTALWLAPAAADDALVSAGNCGWLTRNSPTTGNVLYPDEDAVYYVAALPEPPPGLRYRIRGEFPHARYISFISYNGLPVDAVLDVDIEPDAGSTNPFLPGADRTVAARSYTVPILAEAPPADPADREPGALYVGAGQHGVPTPVPYLLYRIYVPDAGTHPRGGVDVPVIALVADAAAGGADLAPVPCEGVRDARPDLELVQEMITGLGFPARPPFPGRGATDPATWQVQSGLTAALLGPLGLGDLVSGGPASNPHNNYIQTTLSLAFGDVVVIHAKAPTAPRTRDAEPVMGSGDLRYWSLCQNSRSTRYVDCTSDEDVVLDADGAFTVVVSAPEHRPANAENWLAYGPEPDAIFLYRHMLPSPAFFPHSAQGVAESGLPIEDAMGAYYPEVVYCSKAEFESDRCGF